MEHERRQILGMLEAGQINADEAAELLAALSEPEGEIPEAAPPSRRPEEVREARWARFWIYPLMGGGVVLILGALIMGLVYAVDAAPGWRICGWTPLILGLAVTFLALWSRQATWLHLRVKEEEGRSIAFSFPLPLSLAAWALRIAQPFVPQLGDTGVDDLIIALRQSTAQGEPLFIDVEDDEKGERVEIYIG
jgi:MFS family permease